MTYNEWMQYIHAQSTNLNATTITTTHGLRPLHTPQRCGLPGGRYKCLPDNGMQFMRQRNEGHGL